MELFTDAALRLHIDLTKTKGPYICQLELEEDNVKPKGVRATELGDLCLAHR